MAGSELKALAGTRWAGKGELFLDPLGNEAHHYECTMSIGEATVSYVWSHEGKAHEGAFTLRAGGADWIDSWHQPTPMDCKAIAGAWGLLAVQGVYPGGGDDWGWRTTLSRRPTGEMVLQMTNIAPWGEETRAVRMVFTGR